MPRTVPPDRLSRLFQAAAEAFIANGYARTQMADVARAIGLGSGTLYLYVETKEALFDATLRYFATGFVPDELPVKNPAPRATLGTIRELLASESARALDPLRDAGGRRRVRDVGAELERVVGELYDVMHRFRIPLKVVDRCAKDHPELASIWFKEGREAALGLLARYFEKRMSTGHFRALAEPLVAARIVLEAVAFWAIHRHWDPSPQAVEHPDARASVLAFVRAALCKEA
jgi:AcrR family transcriptional regulator